jgi:hypothetical protein
MNLEIIVFILRWLCGVFCVLALGYNAVVSMVKQDNSAVALSLIGVWLVWSL